MISDIDTKQIVDNSIDAINSYMINKLKYHYVSRSFDYHPYSGDQYKFHYRLLTIRYTITISKLDKTFIVSFDGYLTINDQNYLDNIIKHNQDILIRKKEIYEILNE